MTMAGGHARRQYRGVARHVARLEATLRDLRRRTDASVRGLHAIRARTSKVIEATAAFTALSEELVSLSRSLWSPPIAQRLKEDAGAREAFARRLRSLLEELEALERRHAAELSCAPSTSAGKKRWWRLFW